MAADFESFFVPPLEGQNDLKIISTGLLLSSWSLVAFLNGSCLSK